MVDSTTRGDWNSSLEIERAPQRRSSIYIAEEIYDLWQKRSSISSSPNWRSCIEEIELGMGVGSHWGEGGSPDPHSSTLHPPRPKPHLGELGMGVFGGRFPHLHPRSSFSSFLISIFSNSKFGHLNLSIHPVSISNRINNQNIQSKIFNLFNLIQN